METGSKGRRRRRKATPIAIVVAVLSLVLALSGVLMLYSGLMIILKRHAPTAADTVEWVGSLPWVVLMFALMFGFMRLFEWMTGSELRSTSSRPPAEDEDR